MGKEIPNRQKKRVMPPRPDPGSYKTSRPQKRRKKKRREVVAEE